MIADSRTFPTLENTRGFTSRNSRRQTVGYRRRQKPVVPPGTESHESQSSFPTHSTAGADLTLDEFRYLSKELDVPSSADVRINDGKVVGNIQSTVNPCFLALGKAVTHEISESGHWQPG